ncbi:MAG: dihydrofolate reductase family protein [Candidatus Latescibacterota bacterium]
MDGFIAPPDGSVDWLSPFDGGDAFEGDDEHSYRAFYASVDAVVMGRRTYEKVLGFGAWPYAGKPCWVCARRGGVPVQSDVVLTAAPPAEVMAQVAARGCQRAWMVGGGRLASAFAAAGLVTELIVSAIPVLLGGGTLLFDPPAPRATLRLTDSHDFGDGIVRWRYAAAPAGAAAAHD